MAGRPVRYAAYGSNLHPRRLVARTASARLLGTAYLPEWSLQFHKLSRDGSGKCSIRAGSTGIHVAVYEMSLADKAVLDEIEGVGAGYTGIRLDVPGYGECLSYTASESHIDESLVPYDWYMALVIVGASLHRFPGPYLESLRQVRVSIDPDDGRRQRMWDIVEGVSRA